MSGWLLIWILFGAGLFPLGYGMYILLSKERREEREQRRAGVAFTAVGLTMMAPVLWVAAPLLLRLFAR